MAADFNAGSIEGTLDLDSTPFKAGLDKARMDAKSFEDGKIAPKADLDKTAFDAKKDEATVAADKLGAKKVEPKADMDISSFMAKYAILSKMLDAGGGGHSFASFAGSASKIGLLVSGLLSVVAAAGPAGAAMAAFGGASVVALGGVYMALGLFAGAAKTAFGEIAAANKAGVTLTGWAGKAQAALKGLTDGWKSLVDSVKPQMFHLFTQTFSGVAAILPKLRPLLAATTEGVSHLVDSVLQLTRQPIFERFLHSLQQFMGGFLAGAGPVIANLLHAFMNAFIVLSPLMASLGHGLQTAAAAAEKFTAGSGLKSFLGYAQKAIPEVTGLVGHLIHGLFNLVAGLKPLAGPALAFLGALVSAVGNLHLSPLAKGIGDVLSAIQPLLPVAGQLINIVLRPLGHLLSDIAHGPLKAITTGIRGELRPAFGALRGILHDLVKPLADFAGSIANLANPTGIHLVAVLLKSIQGIVHTLAPAFGKLAVALEGMIDNGINTLIPILPPLAAGLGHIATALVPVVNLMAELLAHRAVADVVLGLAAAVFIGVKAFEAYRAIMAGVELLQAAYATAMLGSAAATDAGGLSLVIYVARLLAVKAAQALAAAGSAVMTAAQWALNTAMDANPIGLVVIAIAALAAGLIYAYKHSQTFRAIVNAAFTDVKNIAKNVFDWLKTAVVDAIDFVKAHWELILSIMTGPIGAAAIFVITHFGQIRDFISSVISNVVSTVSNGISNVVGFFTGLPGRILALDGMMLNAGKSLMGAIFRGLESAATAVGGFAANIAGSIWSELKSVLNSVLPHSLPIHVGPIHKTIPLFPYLAKGGITDGMTSFVAGDNPGGREAVIPLDKYDLPRRGEGDRHAAQTHADNSQMIALLSGILAHLSGNGNDGLAEAIANALDTHNTRTMRGLLQAARAA